MLRPITHRIPRPHRWCRSTTYGLAAKSYGFSLPLSAMDLTEKSVADRLTDKKKRLAFADWAAEVIAMTAYPLGEPTILCSRMDESIIIDYYTSKEVHPRNPCPSQSTKKEVSPHGKKRRN